MESFKWEEEIIIFLLTLETEFLKEHKIKRLNCETFLGIDHWEKSGDSLSQCQNCLENIPKWQGNYPEVGEHKVSWTINSFCQGLVV